MCGIAGYIGNNKATPIIIDILKMLEYRGYDSVGVATLNDKKIDIVKSVGKIDKLKSIINEYNLQGNIGIGHTRWATHGVLNDKNAHPHFNKDKSIAVVHNGIIENYKYLKKDLIDKGYEFISEVDSEAIVHLLDDCKIENKIEKIRYVINKLEGDYTFCVLFNNDNNIYCVKKGPSVVIGKGSDGNYISSDIQSISNYTKDIYYVDDNEIVILSKDNIKFYDKDNNLINKQSKYIDINVNHLKKGEYAHYMLKEIYEQPEAISNTLKSRIKNGLVDLSELNISEDYIKNIKKIIIVGCGSSNNVGCAVKYMIEEVIGIPVYTEIASEFRYKKNIINDNDFVIFITQSGETADTLSALREIKKTTNCKTLAITNVKNSNITILADFILYTYAGPEMAVATTKAYSAQLIIVYLLTIYFARIKNKITIEEEKNFINDLNELPNKILKILSQSSNIKELASKFINIKKVFFLGRIIDYAVCRECSLKLKEVAKINSEAYVSGELKHGTLALVDKDTLIIGIMTDKNLIKKTMSNVLETKTRNATIICETQEINKDIENSCDYSIYIPNVNRYFMPSLAVIPFQLFSYYISVFKNLDPDYPNNLSKSVTVE